MSAEIIPFRSRIEIAEAELAKLPPYGRHLAEGLLRLMPNYRYDLSDLPELDRVPAPGLPSAIAAAKAILRRIG
jgi:hypothetical protein